VQVVEVLLSNSAEKNSKNRWGQTPLAEAIQGKQTSCVELLQQWKATLDFGQSVGILCDAASRGDVVILKQLIENNMDPCVGDYDERTALHLAAAEGHEKAVEYLIQSKADINAEDRWGERPIQDAIKSGHVLLATLIHSKGVVCFTRHSHTLLSTCKNFFGFYKCLHSKGCPCGHIFLNKQDCNCIRNM
jgi:ankyrin repeat protein